MMDYEECEDTYSHFLKKQKKKSNIMQQ